MTPAKILLNLALPAAILIGAWLLAPRAAELPPSLAGIKVYGFYFVLTVGLLLALVFRRGRIVFALLTLALAYLCYGVLLRDGLAGFRAHTLFAALGVFVPLNLALLCLLPERGTFNVHGLQRAGVLCGSFIRRPRASRRGRFHLSSRPRCSPRRRSGNWAGLF